MKIKNICKIYLCNKCLNIHTSLFRLLNKPKNIDNKNISKEFKNSGFEDSTFCTNKSLIPLSVNRSIKSND